MEENMNESAITRTEVQQRLNDLHRAAKKDRWRFLGLILKNLPTLITGKKPALFKSHEAKAKALKNIYISISPAEGKKGSSLPLTLVHFLDKLASCPGL